jgi:hypothetical protein
MPEGNIVIIEISLSDDYEVFGKIPDRELDDLERFTRQANGESKNIVKSDAGIHFRLLEMEINGSDESLELQAELLVKLDALTSEEPAGLSVRAYIIPGESEAFRFERQIKRDSIYEVMQIVSKYKSIELPEESCEGDEPVASNEDTERIWAYVAPMLNENSK